MVLLNRSKRFWCQPELLLDDISKLSSRTVLSGLRCSWNTWIRERFCTDILSSEIQDLRSNTLSNARDERHALLPGQVPETAPLLLLLLLLRLLLPVIVVCPTTPKEKEKNNESPCFFCPCSFKGLWPEKGQQPPPPQKKMVSFCICFFLPFFLFLLLLLSFFLYLPFFLSPPSFASHGKKEKKEERERERERKQDSNKKKR